MCLKYIFHSKSFQKLKPVIIFNIAVLIGFGKNYCISPGYCYVRCIISLSLVSLPDSHGALAQIQWRILRGKGRWFAIESVKKLNQFGFFARIAQKRWPVNIFSCNEYLFWWSLPFACKNDLIYLCIKRVYIFLECSIKLSRNDKSGLFYSWHKAKLVYRSLSTGEIDLFYLWNKVCVFTQNSLGIKRVSVFYS